MFSMLAVGVVLAYVALYGTARGTHLLVERYCSSYLGSEGYCCVRSIGPRDGWIDDPDWVRLLANASGYVFAPLCGSERQIRDWIDPLDDNDQPAQVLPGTGL